MQISVIVLTWNGAKFIDDCLRALLEQDRDCEIIVVDNASIDDSVSICQKYAPRVCLIRNDHNLGFAAGNNRGIHEARGDILILLNQDTVVRPGWLRAIEETFADPAIGIVGCKALYPDGRGIQHAGGIIQPGSALARHIGWGEQDHGQYDRVCDADYVTGAAFATRREVLERLGGLDEKFYPAFYEEVDCCYRARRAGFRVVYQPRAVLEHSETTSFPEGDHTRTMAYHRNRVRFILRHWCANELDAFFTTEAQAITTSGLIDDVVAYARAYWDNLLGLPLIAAQRRKDLTLGGPLSYAAVRRVIEGLQSLRQQAHQRIAALIMMRAALAEQKVSSAEYLPVLQCALPDTVEMAGLYTHIEDLEPQAILHLPRSQSRIPVIGRFIDALYNFGVTPVMRLLLRPYLNQQNEFNLRTFRSLATLMRSTDALSRLQQLHGADESAVVMQLLELADHLEQEHKGGSA